MHHHVFDTLAAVAMVDHAGFQVLRVDHLKPFHIIVVAKCCDRVPDNGSFLEPDAEYIRRSPFRSGRPPIERSPFLKNAVTHLFQQWRIL
jgi:hypothetical protein